MLAITDQLCEACLDLEYAELARELVARLARKRPSPLARGEVRIWAAGALYALGQINFLFDRSQQPHMTADQLAGQLAVAKTTMANKAATVRRTLDLGYCEPGLTRQSLDENPPPALLALALHATTSPRQSTGSIDDGAARPAASTASTPPRLSACSTRPGWFPPPHRAGLASMAQLSADGVMQQPPRDATTSAV